MNTMLLLPPHPIIMDRDDIQPETTTTPTPQGWWNWLRSFLPSSTPAPAAPHTKLYLLVDRSASMTVRAPIVVAGYNQFIKKQKDLQVEGETCDVSTYFFSTTIEIVKEDIPLAEMEDLTHDDFKPHGMTALRDATAHIYDRILHETSLPSNTRRIVVILTDGKENASVNTSINQLGELREQVSPMAEIIYMGSNQDALASGAEVGASRDTSLSYNDNNLLEALDSMGNAVSRARSGQDPLGALRFTAVERGRSAGISIRSVSSAETIIC